MLNLRRTQHILFTVIWKEEMLYLRRTQHILFTVIWKEEMLYLTTHSTHFIYGYMEGINALFNDALNTFYLRLYGRKEMFYLTTHSTHFIYGYMEGRKCFI